MTDHLEPKPGSNGTPIPPNSGTDPEQVTQSKVNLEQLQSSVERLTGLVRSLQSEKDKGVSQVKKDVSEIQDALARYDKLRVKGMDAEEAIAEIVNGATIQDQLKTLTETVNRLAAGSGTGTPLPGSSDVTQVFAKVGLDPNDPDVLIAASELKGKSPEAIELAAYRLRDRKATQPEPTPAQAAALRNGPPTPPNKGAEIEAGYLADVAKVPRGNIDALNQVKRKWREEARKAGLQLNV